MLLLSEEETANSELTMMRNAEDWRRLAFERIVENKRSRTDETGESEYKQGDLVMLRVFNRTKLDPPYRGPYVVLGCAPPNYIHDVNGRQKVFI